LLRQTKRATLRTWAVEKDKLEELDLLADLSRDSADVIIRSAGLSPNMWVTRHPLLLWTPRGAPMGPTYVNAGAPCFPDVVHLNCYTEKTMLYNGASMPDSAP